MTIGFRHQQERSRFVEPTFDVPQAGPHAAWPGERCGGAAPPGRLSGAGAEEPY